MRNISFDNFGIVPAAVHFHTAVVSHSFCHISLSVIFIFQLTVSRCMLWCCFVPHSRHMILKVIIHIGGFGFTCNLKFPFANRQGIGFCPFAFAWGKIQIFLHKTSDTKKQKSYNCYVIYYYKNNDNSEYYYIFYRLYIRIQRHLL